MSHLDLSDIEALGSGLLDLTDEMQYSGDLVNSDSRDAFLHKSELREIKICIKFHPEAGRDFANENSTFGRIVESQRGFCKY